MTRKESWFPIFGLTVHGATKTSPAFLMRTHWNRHGQWVTSSLLACQLNKGTRCFGWRDYSSVCDTGSFVVRSSRHLSFNERILLNPPSQLPCPQPPNFCKHERIRREGRRIGTYEWCMGCEAQQVGANGGCNGRDYISPSSTPPPHVVSPTLPLPLLDQFWPFPFRVSA